MESLRGGNIYYKQRLQKNKGKEKSNFADMKNKRKKEKL